MRTKAILCAAALAAGAVSATAQNVYSLNVVGYVNSSVAGNANVYYQMIANPLNATDNTIGALITAAPDFTSLYKWGGSGFQIATFLFGGWDDGSYTLNPGEGAIVSSSEPWSVTWVGEVKQGSLDNNMPAGYSIRSSIVPQTGTLTELGLPISNFQDFDTILKFDPVAQSYVIYTALFGSWDPSEPVIAPGEAFWANTAAGALWHRDFTVQ